MTGPLPSDTPGLIYFAQAIGGGPVKIGWTSGDPRHRLAVLQSANPFELTLTRVIPGTRLDEHRLHHRHQHDRLRGEWFYPSATIAELANAKGEDALLEVALAAYDTLTPEEQATPR